MTEDPVEQLFARLGADHDLPEPTRAEIDAALDLARIVAHGSVRRAAPLVCYAVGLSLGAEAPPAERAARLRELSEQLEAAPADG